MLFPMLIKQKMGYINSAGTVVVPATFQYAYPFANGYAYALGIEGDDVILDVNGIICKHLRHDQVNLEEGQFHEGLAAVKEVASGRYGFMDPFGEWRIVPQFEPLWDASVETSLPLYRFSEGQAAFIQDHFWGVMDSSGAITVSPRFHWLSLFSEGLAAAFDEEGMGYIDATGQWILPPEYDFVETLDNCFSEGLVPMSKGSDYIGYLDRSGNWVIPPQFEAAGKFSQGLARVCRDGKEGYIDRTGHWIITLPENVTLLWKESEADLHYQDGDFHEGLAVVTCHWDLGPEQPPVHREGYLNVQGEVVIEPAYLHAKRFQGGLARVDGRYVNSSGEVIWRDDWNLETLS